MKTVSFFISFLFLISGSSAQNLNNTSFVKVDIGGLFPTVSNYKIGPVVNVSFTSPLTNILLVSLNSEFAFPQTNIDASVFNYAVFGDLIMPFSPEANSTFYIGAGIGIFENRFTHNSITYKSGISGGVKASFGAVFIPENWDYLLLDVRGGFKNIFFSGKDWNDFTLTIGLGMFLGK